MRKIAGLLAILILMASTVSAQFWKEKDFRKWSKAECEKLLADSPWAKNRPLSDVVIRPLMTGSLPSREGNPEIIYQARFLSALPIRQAIAQQERLDPRFKKLSPDERKAVEEREANWLKLDFGDDIVIQVVYQTNMPVLLQDLDRVWASRPAESWKLDTYLITAKGKIAPIDVLRPPARGEFQLVFPRTVKGHPLLQADDKVLALEFVHPGAGIFPRERVYLEFKVQEMLLDGRLVH